MVEWNSITLRFISAKNLGKTLTEALQLLFSKLRTLRHLLALELRTDSFLHNKIIITCAKSLACLVALVNLSPDLGALINSLTSNVVLY
jgi:hypothetical protein